MSFCLRVTLFTLFASIAAVHAFPSSWKDFLDRRALSKARSNCWALAPLDACSSPLTNQLAGLGHNEIRKKFLQTSLREICNSLQSTYICEEDALASRCSSEEMKSLPANLVRERSFANFTLDYMCNREFTVFESDKPCLLGTHDGQTLPQMIYRQCQDDKDYREPALCSFLPSRRITRCAMEVVRKTCSERVADRLDTLLTQFRTTYDC